MSAALKTPTRIDWVDYAKGICIILVVMMHSTLGVSAAMGAENWLNGFIEWARPFRMPDFFLISGLFLAARIDRPWRAYADTKILHFVYFYLLWMTIQCALKCWDGGLAGWGAHWLNHLVEPMGTLWFIYVLVLFFVTVKLLRKVPFWIVWPAAFALEVLPIHTGWLAIDQFAERFVYFYTGYIAARWIMAYADGVARVDVPSIIAFLATWNLVNLWGVQSGVAFMPILSIIYGFAGCAAVIAVAQLMSRVRWFDFVRYCGANTLPIYLAFFVFMAASRVLLIKSGFIADGGVISLLVTAAGVIGPLILHWIVVRTPARFLFVRPAFARMPAVAADKTASADTRLPAKPV